MADVDYDDYDAGYVDPMPVAGLSGHRLSRVIHIGGAACSVGLVLWLGWWGYDAAVRSAQGVPVIHAPKEPMRRAPENPGGEVAEHQGLAVNDIAAIGTAAPPPDRLMLAPRPMDLTAEDVAGLTPLNVTATSPAPAGAEALAALAAPAVPLVDPVTPVVPVAAPAPATTDAVAAALAEALDPMAPAEDMPSLSLEAPDMAEAPATDPSTPIRPRARPGALATEPALALDAAAALPVSEIDPTTLTEGTRLAQMGAYDSPEQARAEWVKLTNLFGDLLQGKSMVIQSAESGGRNFFRLRAAGFQGEDDSRAFCTAIVERQGTCIPVVHR